MADEIRRRRTSDPEMDAMLVLTQALEPLDRHAATRVLKWAEDRYVREHSFLPKESLEALNNFTSGMEEMGKRLAVRPRQVLTAMAKVADQVEVGSDG